MLPEPLKKVLQETKFLEREAEKPLFSDTTPLHYSRNKYSTLFAEICKAKLMSKDYSLNADAGFDSKEFRAVCEQKEIMANIPHNPRNEKKVESTDYQYFDEELYKRRYVIERANAWQD